MTAGEPAPAGPAPGKDRIEALDALRGFALFGILLANLPYWAGLPFASPEELKALAGRIDLQAFSAFFNFVLDGKFYTLFSLLFGLGFALQLDRLERRGADGLRIFRRRMAALLLIGCLHIFLIWDGDILTLYAALGFALPLFRRTSDRALLVWALAFLFGVPVAGVALCAAAGIEPGAPLFALASAITAAQGIDNAKIAPIAFVGHGGWHEFVVWQSTGWAYNYGERLDNWRIAKVLGTMLLGMLAGRYLLRGQLLENRRLLWIVLVGGLVIGVPANLAYAHLPPHSQASWSSLIGTAPQGLAYGAAFLLAWPHARAVLGLLSPVGRMALTNYLTQSVVGDLIFYGIGLGMMGRIEILFVYAIALVLYAGQILLSRWWLARRRQGPMEALWRRMTYGAPSGEGAPLAA
ncbi:DUF418 domain-containing protein [Novosphingobium sp. H3SJ31-1]|uniref:DUF418 domain-containing protein n=2 Tax=Novosphingobium album (ex Liu et al. 2023) TaxID=3031130 RepID=A0ABT5WM43_9SPHN|nr:DUF418 domain-containing protein [Novosphingobium album (ex Liu et al. 2023)]